MEIYVSEYFKFFRLYYINVTKQTVAFKYYHRFKIDRLLLEGYSKTIMYQPLGHIKFLKPSGLMALGALGLYKFDMARWNST